MRETNARTLDRYSAAKNAPVDVDTAIDLCTDDFWYETMALGHRHTKEEYREFLTHFYAAFPDYEGHFEGRVVDDECAVVWGRFTGTFKENFLGFEPTGRRIDVPVTFVVTFRDGLLSSDRGYFDLATFANQAGIPIDQISALRAAA